MIIKAYDIKQPYLCFVDLEFNNQQLVQFASLIFKRIDNDTYQLIRSCNQYISTKICYPFVEYTNITSTFLAENGIRLEDLIGFIEDDFLKDIPISNTLLISHGLKNDLIVLNKSNLPIFNEFAHYCTFLQSRKILNRSTHLTLEDLAIESGYFLHNAHNAYNDVWAVVSVFTYLQKIKKQKEGEN